MIVLPIRDQNLLKEPQEALLARVRRQIGPLVGASLSLERQRGWYINLQIFRPITPDERHVIKTIVAETEVPVEIEEKGAAPRLLPRARGKAAPNRLKSIGPG